MTHHINENCSGCMLCQRVCPVNAISGEKKQLHSIDANLCIDCGVCGRVCAFNAVQDAAGKSVEKVKRSEWLKPIWDYDSCVACNICVMACPTGVIALQFPNGDRRRDSLPYLQNAKNFIGCSFCADSCPTDAIMMQSVEWIAKGNNTLLED